jgi:2-(1,2-epoxy-1,2-dihydrophenyl)acetyl-CoA isomerase
MYAVYLDEGVDGLMDYLVDVWMPAVQRTVRALWSVPKPLVAAFNGAATAGGLDFGLSCDGRVAASTARFAESYVNLGMVPVAGGIFLLPRLVGPAAATELIASGELIGAERAQALGLVNEVCEPDELTTRSAELANRLAKGPTAAFTTLKQVMRRAETEELEQVLQASYQANVDLLTQHDVRKRVVAVMERYSLSEAASR